MKHMMLPQKAMEIRRSILKMIFNAGSGHVDSSFSAVEILVVLYYTILRIRPDEPNWEDRDRFILSKGHAVPAVYAILSDLGFFPSSDLTTLRKITSHLQGHPSLETPGIDVATGSLGQGLSIGCGIAYANERLSSDPKRRVYVLLGDGELNEGQIWEAAMLAAHFELNSLTAIIDCNGLQYTGSTSEVMNSAPLAQKFEAFGWNVLPVDGHSFDELHHAFVQAERYSSPTTILAQTIKGKGVSFMENNLEWHGKAPSRAEYEKALEELSVAEQ